MTTSHVGLAAFAALAITLTACRGESRTAGVTIEAAPRELVLFVGESGTVSMTITANEVPDGGSVRLLPESSSLDEQVVASPHVVDYSPQQLELSEGQSGTMQVDVVCLSEGETTLHFMASSGSPILKRFVDGGQVLVTCSEEDVTGSDSGESTGESSTPSPETAGADTGPTDPTTGTTGDSSGTTGGSSGTTGSPTGCATDPLASGPISVTASTIAVDVDADTCDVVCSFDVLNEHSVAVYATYAPHSLGDPIRLLQQETGSNSGTIESMSSVTYDVVVSDCTSSMAEVVTLQFYDDFNGKMWEVPIAVDTTAL